MVLGMHRSLLVNASKKILDPVKRAENVDTGTREISLRRELRSRTGSVPAKMLSRSHERTKGVSVRVRETSPSQSTYAVTRSMPTWYRLLGGKDSTQYVETLKLEDGKMITSASQNLPFGGKAETRIVFVPDGTSTVVIGTVRPLASEPRPKNRAESLQELR